MIDAYLKNGELFLGEEEIGEITPEVIEEAYLRPVVEMANGAPVDSDEDALALLKVFGFELSSKTKDILGGLTDGKRGTCSICGRETKVVQNKAFIFPFERKIDSVVSDATRLHFCLEHAFKLYSAMAYLYTVPVGDSTLRFFFDAPERELKRFKRTFKDDFWRESFRVTAETRNGKRRYYFSVNLSLSRYHPNEAFFAVLHEFVKFLKNRRLLKETVEVGKTVKVYLVYGSKQFYGERKGEGAEEERVCQKGNE
ncbi:hypothetical protein ADU37_CDS18160 [Thermococcus sp. 2319x1]|uniref:hypothetical protein n=1 Tax=Thermococcus sp. 2319x1 TaxID=1674923 RepID=UPI00073A99D7|nr:hypothetical protein [Thermococcus sp. 2319x1]ALV63515.1 hypothetical protein ADU37_CDS18160 [Thermococcus sp. 2319x1]